MRYLIIYYFVINFLAFLLYGLDKQKAKRKAWRISESTLLCIAFVGGGIGTLLGMFFFHHKTKHIKFIVLVPLFILVHIGGLLWIVY